VEVALSSPAAWEKMPPPRRRLETWSLSSSPCLTRVVSVDRGRRLQGPRYGLAVGGTSFSTGIGMVVSRKTRPSALSIVFLLDIELCLFNGSRTSPKKITSWYLVWYIFICCGLFWFKHIDFCNPMTHRIFQYSPILSTRAEHLIVLSMRCKP
jgi:hypothetical protein